MNGIYKLNWNLAMFIVVLVTLTVLYNSDKFIVETVCFIVVGIYLMLAHNRIADGVGDEYKNKSKK